MKYIYNVDDRVRISYIPSMFHRAYDEHWSTEIFTIIKRKLNQGYEQYQIKATDNSLISGWFYPMELQKVKIIQNETYKIETILKRRRRNNTTELLVRWLNLPKRFDSWILERDIQNINNDGEGI